MSKWQPGKSGNPKGRPKGKETHSTSVRKLIQSHSDEIVLKVVELALSGDGSALKLCLERICPPLKAKEEATPFAFVTDVSVTQQGREILAAVMDGSLTPQEAGIMLSNLIKQIKLIEFGEITVLIKELQNGLDEMSKQTSQSPHAPEAEYYIEEPTE